MAIYIYIYVSSEIVIFAARTLLIQGDIQPFILVEHGIEYTFNNQARFNNKIKSALFEEYLDILLG